MSTFGDRFKKLRLSKSLTQEQLAEDFNKKYGYSFNKATISQYENNKRTPEITAIMNFVDYFKTSLDYLLCNDRYILREIGGVYCIGDNSDCIELQDIVDMINNIILNGKVKVYNKKLDQDEIKIVHNCLEIVLELVKRDALSKKK
ncbi:transcriptional regulator with XRE-family HTH domain [Clostridium algifaecis]|uniref:Transcriptional regulator with XRE-family HTH domain n=1 Tax=Clostridium algifaecis TaxID=1472040 RepID=A0ABS4KVZ3_9CLOT|nr:helix-turn-helix transcriptional regulator [Clostridium algifaecis]MBP2034198.1 transcriptional regulator with XRE-family HTH domain [Clostridium algifaecis]